MSDPRGGWASPDGWSTPPPGASPEGSTPPPPPAAPAWQPTPGWGGETPGSPPSTWGAPRPPEVKPGVVPLRPLGLGEILDGAVGILRRYPRPTLGLSAAVALVSTLLNLVVLLTAFEPLLTFDEAALERGDTEELEGALGALVAGGGAAVLVSLLSNVVLAGFITTVVGKAVLGQPLSTAEAWRQVRPRLLPLLGLALLVLVIVYAVLLVGVGLGVGVIVLAGAPGALLGVPLIVAAVVAAVYLYVGLALAPCALVLERTAIRKSLRRSLLLVKRSWWRIFGILLLTQVIAQFVSSILQLPFQASGLLPGFGAGVDDVSTGELVATSIGGGIALTLVAPFTAGVLALLYVDRRMRAEGLDVALAASAAGSAGPAAAP